MKKLLIALGVLFILVVAAFALLPSLLDVNRYRGRIQAEMQKQLGREVQLGQMSLSLLPPAFKVQNAVIGEDPSFGSSAPFAQTAELDIQLKLKPLLHREVQVVKVRLVRPQLELIRGSDGRWNFSTIGTHGGQQPTEQPGGEAKPSAETKPLQLDRLQIDDGSVAITDEQKHQPRVQYKDIDVLLRNFAPGQPFDLTISAHLPGGGRGLVKFDGHGGPIQEATLVTTPFSGTLQLDQLSLSGAKQYMNSPQMKGTDASISGNLRLNNNSGKASVAGNVRMESIVVRSKPLGYPVELECNASDDLTRDLVTISNTRLKIGNAPFAISGTINNKSVPAIADLKLNTQNAPIAELVALAQAFGASISPNLQPGGNLAADLTARGPLGAPALAGVLHATQLKVSGLDASSLQVNLNLAPPGENLLQTLSGKVSVNLSDGRLTGVDLSQRLGAIGKFQGVSGVSNGATHVSSLTGDFDLRDGTAYTNNLNALTDAGTVAATGSIGLADQVLNMKATAVLSKSSSQQVGGGSIGGLMTTALANKNGEIVMPLLVGGTVSSPKVSPDTAAIAEMRAKNILPSFSNPGALTHLGGSSGLGGVAGALEGNKTPGAAAANQQQQSGNAVQNAVGNLGGLLGGKKKQ
jgi:AsmA protein